MSRYESIFPDVMLRLHDRNLQAEIKAFVTSLEGDNVGKNVGKQLNERQRVIVDMIAKDGSVNIPQMSGKTAATERTIQRDLQFLQKSGIIRRVGGRKEGYWQINQAE